jgi:hypothetical protein
MVLAGMLKESVKRKARIEGLKEVREERRKRWEEAYAKFGVEMNGVLMLPKTPEVERFLAGEPEE